MGGEKERIIDKLRAEGERIVVDEEMEQRRFAATLKVIQRTVFGQWTAVQESIRHMVPALRDSNRRYRELRKRDPEAAEIIGHMTPGQMAKLRKWLHLPMPLGRPSAGNDDLVRMDEITGRDNSPTTAARQILTERGEKGELKGKADALVKRWTKERQNSG